MRSPHARIASPPRPGAAGVYDGEIVQVPGAELARDESIRPDTSVEKLAGLRALFAR